LPPGLWQIALNHEGDVRQLRFDRARFSSFLASVPISGDYNATATATASRPCTVALLASDGTFLFHAAPSEGFYTYAAAAQCEYPSASHEPEASIGAGAIVGIVIGAMAGVAIVIAAALFVLRYFARRHYHCCVRRRSEVRPLDPL
jgi:hypothetical protein